MFSFKYMQYGFESSWESDNLGQALKRYFKFKNYISPQANVWLEKDGVLIWER